ncbi:MAG: thioesterase family protein [Leptospirales bacterium]
MDKLKEKYKAQLGDTPYSTTNISIRWEEMDVNGHVNYANYLSYYSEARIDAVGQDLFLSLRNEGIGPVIYKAELDFVKEMFHPDVAHIITWVDSIISKTRVSVKQEMYSTNSKELVSKAKFLAIFMNIESRRPVRIPEQIKAKFGFE